MLHLLSRPARPHGRWRALGAAVLAVVSLLTVGARLAGQTQDIAVIVNPDVQVANLTLADLRRVLLGDREFWPSGIRIALLLRAPVARERDVAVQAICEMTEAQFRQHWIAKVFRAESPTSPSLVYSDDMAVDEVSHTSGGLALVAASAVRPGVKVLKIDGLAPGEAGYRLR